MQEYGVTFPIAEEGVTLINKVAVRTASAQNVFGTEADNNNALVTSNK